MTGFNGAFVINSQTKEQLIHEDPKSAEIIRPILRGRDISRYDYDFEDSWLINVHNGIKEKTIPPINIEGYPAVKNHLNHFIDILSKRQDQGVTPYNLRNCAYMDDFSKQKIVWARLSRISKDNVDNFPRFALVKEDMFVLDSCCFMVGEHLPLLIKFLNSEFAYYYFLCNVAALDVGGIQMRQQYVQKIPVPKNLQELACCENCDIDKTIYRLFSLSKEEISFVEKKLKERKQLIVRSISH